MVNAMLTELLKNTYMGLLLQTVRKSKIVPAENESRYGRARSVTQSVKLNDITFRYLPN